MLVRDGSMLTYFRSTPPFTLIVWSTRGAVLFVRSVSLSFLLSALLWSILYFQQGVFIWWQGEQRSDVFILLNCDIFTVTSIVIAVKEDRIFFPLTSASHAVPFSDCLCCLLSDVNAVAVEPLITVITATVSGRSKWRNECMSIDASIHSSWVMKQQH